MLRTPRVVALLAGVTLVCVTSGCVGLACSGAAQYSPHVELDLQPWFTSHPESTITVCFDSVCQTADGTTTGATVNIELRDADLPHPDGDYVLNTAAALPGLAPARTSQRTHLGKYVQDGPCGSNTQWRLTGVMSADGTLALTP